MYEKKLRHEKKYTKKYTKIYEKRRYEKRTRKTLHEKKKSVHYDTQKRI